MSNSGSGSSAQESSWEDMAGKVYAAVTSGDPDDKEMAVAALRATGTSEGDAETVYATAASIAQSAGTREAFFAVLKGEAEAPADLSDDEVEVFGAAWGGVAGGGMAGASGAAGSAGVGKAGAAGASGVARYGNTWEGKGSSGRTWEGKGNA